MAEKKDKLLSFAMKFQDKKFNVHTAMCTKSIKRVVRKMFNSQCLVFGFDIETAKLPQFFDPVEGKKKWPQAGLDYHMSEPRLLIWYDDTVDEIYIIDTFSVGGMEKVTPLIKDFCANRRFVAHNAKFDVGHMRHWGVEMGRCDCTLIMASIIHHAEDSVGMTPQLGLDKLVSKVLKFDISKHLQDSNWNDPKLTKEQIFYAATDSYLTHTLYNIYKDKIREHGLVRIHNLYNKVQNVVVDMQSAGMRMHRAKHREVIVKWEAERDRLKAEVAKTVGGINIRSSKQMTEWLKENLSKEDLARWPLTDKGTALQTSADVLKEFDHLPFVEPLSKYKEYDKLCTTYGRFLYKRRNPITKRLHGGFTIGVTETGRLSSRDPNLQNFPRGKDFKFKELFIPAKGNRLCVADYSQIELRIAANITQDATMLKAYGNGKDLHTLMAAAITHKKMAEVNKDERQIAKACFSGDTEILTKRNGWVRFDEYNGRDPLAVYYLPVGVDVNPVRRSASRFNQSTMSMPFNGVGGEIKFESPLEFREVKDRRFLHHKDRNTDILATEDHEILFLSSNGIVRKTPFSKVKDVRHFISSGWYVGGYTRLSESWSRLLAAAIADGSIQGDVIRYGFTKKRKAKRLVKLYSDVGIKISQKTSSEGVISFRVKEGSNTLRRFFSSKKDLSWSVLDLIDMRAFLEEACFWDSHELCGKVRDRVLFCTTSKQTADVMQAMCSLSGIPSNKYMSKNKKDIKHKDIYRLSYALRTFPLHRVSFKAEVIEERMSSYCVQVSTGNILIRRNGKVSIQGNCNFGLLFGMGASKLAKYAKVSYGVIMTLSEAEKYKEMFHLLYPGYAKWKFKQTKDVEKSLVINTVTGKKRKLSKENFYSCSLNHPVQGAAAEVMAYAMIYVHKAFKDRWMKSQIVNVVHDEMVVDAPLDEIEDVKKIMKSEMERAYLKLFPQATTRDLIEVGVGKSWEEAK